MWKCLFVTTSLLCACGGSSQPAPSLVSALPTRQTLSVAAPGPDAGTQPQGAAPGETAQLYVLTRQTVFDVNGLIGGVLDNVEAVTRTPPSAVSPDSAAWGPITDALSPVAWRLVIQQLGAGQFAFQLDIRPKDGADADFQAFLQGASQGATPEGPSQGTFSVNLSLAQSLDPVGNPDVGQVVASWAVLPDHRELHVGLSGVAGPGGPFATADVAAVFFPDGAGALSFDASASLGAGTGVSDVGRVGSRWIADGAGRADAEVHQPDGGSGAQLTECWNAAFDQVYVQGETSTGDGGTAGNPAACVFADALQ
jgi:hypothetical protein